LKSGSLVSIKKWVAVGYDMQSESRFAEDVGLCIDQIYKVIDRTMAKNAIYSTEIADYQPMDLEDLLGSEYHDCRCRMSRDHYY